MPGIAPQMPPAITAVSTQTSISSIDGRLYQDQSSCLPKIVTTVPPNLMPTHAVANAAMYSWPSAPILSSPQRNATATASPVNISGVAMNSVYPMSLSEPNELPIRW